MGDLGISIIYDDSIELKCLSMKGAVDKVCSVVSLLLRSSNYPLLLVGSSLNYSDLCVIGYIRKLQNYNLVAIFWELELLAMSRVYEIEQFVECLAVKFPEEITSDEWPIFIKRSFELCVAVSVC
jgi:hypothetical protein